MTTKITTSQRITYLAIGIIAGLALTYFYSQWKEKSHG
ncbi:MAG: hypothetical protein MRECE_2c145 [Mycoplasmataceae bacterium CE_OT135]|nr:MAG: hypothetical protein MRECE_2c145 [Mycoplasmataceae bacterium CE_OT135]